MKVIKTILFCLMLCNFLNAQQPAVEWVRKYGNSATNSQDLGNMVVTDDSGNVYVTGIYFSALTGFNNFGTVKYNSSGVVQWDTVYNGASTGSSDDQSFFIAVDDTGNVYVCGKSQQTTAASYDYCTIKYSPSGIPLWINRYDRTGVDEDIPGEMKIDNKGSVYVTGYTYNSPTIYDYTTIKYNAGGTVQWMRHYDGQAGQDDYAYTLDIDDSGNVYVSGSEYYNGTGDFYMTTIKYDSLGFTKWVGKFAGPVGEYARPIDIVADDSGNVYVAGYYERNSYPETVIMKYNAIGDSVWVIRDDTLITIDPVSILLDKNGDVLVTGRGDSGYVTVKYDPMGNFKWKAYFLALGEPSSMATDKDGNVYVTGFGPGAFPNPDADYWTLKYDSSGAEKWRISYSAPPTNSNDGARSITLDTLGNVFVTGVSAESGSNTQFGTIKYAQNVGIYELSNDNTLSIFPNPSSSYFTIRCQTAFQSAQIEMYNNQGGLVKKIDKVSGSSFTIYQQDLPDGIYFVKVTDKGKIYSTKMIIQ